MRSSIRKPVALVAAMLLAMLTVAPAAAVIEAEEAFYNTWARTDLPVENGTVDRTWMWGPGPNTEVLSEEYAEHPTGERPVQYFDKSRMEVNNPNLEYDGLWYVTNGLLVVELMTGMMQVGHEEFVEHEPANIHIAGDPDQPETPTYATYATLTDTPAFAEGATITATVDAAGTVGSNDDLAEWNVTAGVLAPETGHRTASVFWDFMTSEGMIWDWETGDITTGRLFENAYYATGLPVTEAYWSFIYVDGTQQWVLTQAFERRVLTYTPLSDPGWQVEAGNVGQHYYEWRYETAPPPPPVDEHAYVDLHDAEGTLVAMASLADAGEGVDIVVEVTGWEPGTYGTHFHEIGLCEAPDFESAGDHFNAFDTEHGLENPNGPHAGDLPNLVVGEDGTGTLEYTNTLITLGEGDGSLFDDDGTSLIIHSGEDDQVTDPAGNSGDRIACGVVVAGERPDPEPEPQEFHFMLGALNNSGVSGWGTLTLDDGMLTVMFEASGLEANQTHPHHIHGFADFQQSLCPTPGMAGEDGLLEFAEGAPAYGDVALNLAPPSEVGEDGTITYSQTFDLEADELPFTAGNLTAHTIVVHGMTVGDEYVQGLPVACAAIIPEQGFVSLLSGDNVLPEPIESEGTGFATFHVPADHTQIAFTLDVRGLEGVTMAHIHLKNEGEETGPPVLWLFQADDMEAGMTADGIINSAVSGDLDLVGPLEGEPMTALLDAIIAGDTYVNVHTLEHPPGEIRGEMELASDHFDLVHEH